MATVYLLHFNQPYKHSRHYLGFTDDLAERLQRHASGNGARLMEVITGDGAAITWQLARTWEGDRKFERRLKHRKHAALLCPVCSGPGALKRAVYKEKQ